MTTLRRTNYVVWALALVTLIAIPIRAAAHGAGTYAPRYWTNNGPAWKFAPSFPTGAKRQNLEDATS